MASDPRAHVTAILAEVAERPPRRGAFPQAPEELLPLVYPELHRLRGELLLLDEADPKGAEACFRPALAIARKQTAKWFELRAAMSLARLWQSQGKPKQARKLLGPVYGWFTQGFDTQDLKAAKALLEELS
jgi:predicted ATPase